MKVTINGTTYTALKNLSFSPEADMSGDSLPINEFSVQIKTDDSIATYQAAALYDDRDNLWANYWIMAAQKHDDGFVYIKAQTVIALLDKQVKDLNLYVNANFTDLVAECFAYVPANSYTIDSSFSSLKINGYVPEQTARERLQWLCFVAGAYVESAFSDKINIKPIDNTATLIPKEQTYWKPSVNSGDIVTKINVKAFSYVAGTPTPTDDWITDGTPQSYYIQTSTDYSITNNNAPSGTPKNEITIDNVTIVNPDNVSGILTRLAGYYFNSDTVAASVIDNADYVPGQKVVVQVNDEDLKQGFIKSASFAFGLQAKADIELVWTEDVTGGTLIVKSMFNGYCVAKKTYVFPVGHSYSFTNPYIDTMVTGRRYILRPQNASTSGTLSSGTTTIEVPYDLALDYKDSILNIVSVDDVVGGEVTEIG